jgi:hypothetical protein
MEKLNFERIDFSKKSETFDLEYVRLKIFESNVQLTFVDEKKELTNPNKFRLSAIGLSRE